MPWPREDGSHRRAGSGYQRLIQGKGMPHRWCGGKLLSDRFKRLGERICLLRQAS